MDSDPHAGRTMCCYNLVIEWCPLVDLEMR